MYKKKKKSKKKSKKKTIKVFKKNKNKKYHKIVKCICEANKSQHKKVKHTSFSYGFFQRNKNISKKKRRKIGSRRN